MYTSKLDLINTEIAIKYVKDQFEKELAYALNLTRVSAPLFVYSNSGLNDNLSGIERPVRFDSPKYDEEIEIVQSLAKWKRMALAHYNFKENTGLYTDMNAIRRDEIPDKFHSIYVDQWDWEKIINEKQRTIDYLKESVSIIVHTLHLVQNEITKKYPCLDKYINDEVKFLTTYELEKMYPNLNNKERERAITKEYKTVFLMQIGWPLKDGKPHDLRAPDYDDWNLNGDLLIYHPLLDEPCEVSSMGIRVDKESLEKQLKYTNKLSNLKLDYHNSIMKDKLPLTIGGGIGQSRICMLLLNKIHIGEVQASLWPKDELNKAKKEGIVLL